MQGYVALHRKLMESWVSEDPMALALWVRMLMEASHKARTATYKGENYKLCKGGFLFGLNKWSVKTGISREVIRKRLDMLESDGMITRQKHPHISVVTVVNWDSYQKDNTANTRQEHGENTAATRQEQQYNNVDNLDNEKENRQLLASQEKPNNFSEQIKRIFNHWRETMGKDSRAKLNKKREGAIRARLKDGFTVDEICLAITGCAKSAFHMGENDEGKVYDDLALICRDDGKLNMFMKIKDKPAKTGEQDKAGFYQQLASKRFYDE